MRYHDVVHGQKSRGTPRIDNSNHGIKNLNMEFKNSVKLMPNICKTSYNCVICTAPPCKMEKYHMCCQKIQKPDEWITDGENEQNVGCKEWMRFRLWGFHGTKNMKDSDCLFQKILLSRMTFSLHKASIHTIQSLDRPHYWQLSTLNRNHDQHWLCNGDGKNFLVHDWMSNGLLKLWSRNLQMNDFWCSKDFEVKMNTKHS